MLTNFQFLKANLLYLEIELSFSSDCQNRLWIRAKTILLMNQEFINCSISIPIRRAILLESQKAQNLVMLKVN